MREIWGLRDKMFLCLAAAPSVDFIPPTGHSSAGARVGVVCRAKRVRTAGWGRAGCSRRRDSRGTEGRRWDRNRARAHLRVVDVQSTNGASVRAAAASKAAGLRLRRVPAALLRVCPTAGEAHALRRPRRGGHRGPPRPLPPAVVFRYLDQFWSFLLVSSSACWHCGRSRRCSRAH